MGWQRCRQKCIRGDSLAAALAVEAIVRRQGGNSAAAEIARQLQSVIHFGVVNGLAIIF